MRGRVLIVEDDRAMRDLLEERLGAVGFVVAVEESATDALARVRAEEFDVIVSDLNMAEMNGLQLCERISVNRPDIPVIVITAFGSLETAVAAIRVGAYDFLTKPFEMDALVIALDRASKFQSLQDEVKRLQVEVARSRPNKDLIGESPPMLRIHETIRSAAITDTTVFITGETGTGKELVARSLHAQSRRCAGPFVALNCAAMPETLLESELFGHVRGAFTNAVQARKGLLAQANGGTLFLDEIGDMPLTLQPKLLRVIEERSFRPVGSDIESPFDARLVTATHRDLEAAVTDSTFREDLYYRIHVIHIELPPLRARGNDVLGLAQHFVGHFATRSGKCVMGLSGAAARRLLAYSWPGNVRELANCIERAIALTPYEEITVDDLPEKIRDYSASRLPLVGDHPNDLVPLEEIERRYILRVLDSVDGNKSTAAEILGLDRKTLYRKLERYSALPPGPA